MICPNCGAKNIDGYSFCIKCGENLKDIQPPEPEDEAPVQNEQNIDFQESAYDDQPQNNYQEPVFDDKPKNNYQHSARPIDASTAPLNYLMYIIAIILKPLKSFRDEEKKLMNTKTSIIFTLIVTGVMTIINLVKTIFTTVHVASYSWSEGYNYSWEWGNIKNIKWLEVIFKNYIIYACIIFAIALVFYLGSLIIKKQLSFIKTLSITTTSIIPAVIGAMALSPLAGAIWSPLGVVFMVTGMVYSMIILYELMNKELKLEGDTKIYFNLVCLGIIAVAGYYVYMKLFMSSVTSGIDDLMDIFK